MNKKIAITILSFVLLLGNSCTGTKSTAKKTDKEKSAYSETTDTNASAQKTYQKMSEAEQNKFVAEKSDEILQKLGFDKSEKINGKGLELVKPFVDGYARRIDSETKDVCGFGDNLKSMLNRGNSVAKDINEIFKAEKMPVESGLYLAMIESEFCPCIQSPTGPLGIFQFTKANAEKNGLEIKVDASPTNPDQRCEVKPASKAAAKYLKSLSKSNEGAIKTAVAIGNYNVGDVDTKLELSDEIKKSPSSQNSFWLYVTNEKKTSVENKKYLPKFIAAAIVGENPKEFGVDISQLSQVK